MQKEVSSLKLLVENLQKENEELKARFNGDTDEDSKVENLKKEIEELKAKLQNRSDSMCRKYLLLKQEIQIWSKPIHIVLNQNLRRPHSIEYVKKVKKI